MKKSTSKLLANSHRLLPVPADNTKPECCQTYTKTKNNKKFTNWPMQIF